MPQYKLIVIDEAGFEIEVAGTFDTEDELAQWARDNEGNIDDFA